MYYKYIDKYGYGSPFFYIHPLKQKAVRRLVDNLPTGTEYALVFGSALLPACREESDIDIALIGNIDGKINFRDLISDKTERNGCEYDIVTFPSIGYLREKAARSIQNGERSILEKGLVVYGI
jgi:predicted nucleotidyltransferase